MKTQIITIHGGETFGSYESYISWLKSFELDISDTDKKSWKDSLSEKLGEDYEILALRMPNSMNAKYLEWKIWFEKYLPYIQDNVIFVGNSLGGIFLAKYFSENDYSRSIKGIFMLAAPFEKVSLTDDMADFVLQNDLSKLALYGNKVHLYHSKDDQVVPFTHLAQYQNMLPNAIIRTFETMGHFRVSEIPELIEDIKSLAYQKSVLK
jgi:predicted alpha/beta hydrolase family esterase